MATKGLELMAYTPDETVNKLDYFIELFAHKKSASQNLRNQVQIALDEYTAVAAADKGKMATTYTAAGGDPLDLTADKAKFEAVIAAIDAQFPQS